MEVCGIFERLLNRLAVADSCMNMPQLTEEQRRRIETNRLLALQRRQAWAAQQISQLSVSAQQSKDKQRANGQVFIHCPYSEKDEAKGLGAQWDVSNKKWYLKHGTALRPFAAWLSSQDKQELLDAEKNELSSREGSLLLFQDWAGCKSCSEWVNKIWESCPTCALADRYMQEVKEQVALRLNGCSRYHRASVLTHFLVPRFIAKPPQQHMPASTMTLQSVLQNFRELFYVPNLMLSNVQMIEIGKLYASAPFSTTSNSAFMGESIEDSISALQGHLSAFLQNDDDWEQTAQLLTRIHLPPSERNISEEFEAKLLVRMAELHLENNDLLDTRAAVEQAERVLCMTPLAHLSFKYTLLKVRARVMDLERKFNDAARHYLDLSRFDKSTVVAGMQRDESCSSSEATHTRGSSSDAVHKVMLGEGNAQGQELVALTRAAMCAILAPAGLARSQTLALLIEDKRAHMTAPFSVLQKVHMGLTVMDDELTELEKLLLPHQRQPIGPDAVTLLQRAIEEHNKAVEDKKELQKHLLHGVTDGSDEPATLRKRNRTDALRPPRSTHNHQALRWMESRGYWVLAQDFQGFKSFGTFSCACRKTWISAHAYPAYRQGCKGCDRESQPCCLWHNETLKLSTNESPSVHRHHAPPHDSMRCQACRLGVCFA